jgi:uncharacterized protein (DUF2164 family)
MTEQNSSISNFKRFLFRLLLPAIAITGIAGLGFNYAFEHIIVMDGKTSGAYKIRRIIKEKHPDEIPIFGSSRAEGGYLPDSLGPNFYNYGLSGSCADVTTFFMQQECKKKKNTPWIIVNIELNGIVRLYGNIANFIPNTGNKGIRTILGKDCKANYRIPFLRYFGQYEFYIRDYLNNKIQLTKAINKGAAIEKNEVDPAEFAAQVAQRKIEGEVFDIDSSLLKEFISVIANHPEREFILVVAPYHKSYYESYRTPAVAKAFFDLVLSYPNTHVIDLGHLDLSDDMYFNTTHLRINGAAVFCRALRDSLAAIGVR